MVINLFACDCCGYSIFASPDPFFAMCPICFWSQDYWQAEYPSKTGGDNSHSLNEGRMVWPKYAREFRKELYEECLRNREMPQTTVLTLGFSDDELRHMGFEESITNPESPIESCKRLYPVVEALREKIPPQRYVRLVRALDEANLPSVVYESMWSLIKYEIELPESLHAVLVGEDSRGQRVQTLFDRHTELLHSRLRRIETASALPREAKSAFQSFLQQKKYPSAAKLLLQHVAQDNEHYAELDWVAMRLELEGTRWEGLEERLYHLLDDLKGIVPDSELWIYANFILHKEYSEGVEFWLWRMYELGIVLPKKIYDDFARLAQEMRLEDFYMEGVKYAEEDGVRP